MATEIDSLQIKIETQSGNASKNIDALVTSLGNLKGASKLNATTSNLDKLSNSLSGLNKGFSNMFKGLNLAAITMVARKIGQVVSASVSSINDYVENVNLFTVSMGEYADEAMEYAQRVSDSLGVDLSEFVRNQGIFMSMASGFGLASEQAYKMSRGLTELSYDLSSFFNISLDAVGDGAFAKVQSGIAGELEPLRRLGFALDEATLQQTAYDHGIRASVRTMNQAQKATLRYTTIVEQASKMGVIGDLSRTLITPANAIRILKQQTEQLSRAFGSLFIPILIKVIPYVQAFVKVLTQAVQKLAELWGFTMPSIDYSGMSSGAADMAEGLDESAENAKKLKNYMMGFDELNVIDTSSSEAASSGNGLSNDLGIDVDSIWDESIFANLESQVDSLMPKMESLAKTLGIVALALGGLKVGADIISGLASLKTNLEVLGGADLLGKLGGFKTFLATLGGGSASVGIFSLAAAVLAVASAWYYVYKNFDQVKAVFKGFFEQSIAPKIEEIKEAFNGLKDTLQPVVEKMKPVIDAVKSFITETLGINSLGEVFEFIGGIIFNVFASNVAGTFASLMSIISGAIQFATGFVQLVKGWVDFVVSLFTGDLKGAETAVGEIKEGIVKIFSGLWDATGGAILSFVEGVVSWFDNLYMEITGSETGLVQKIIDGVVGGFTSLKEKISTALENAWTAIKEKWAALKTWFTQNVAPKFTLQYWLDKFADMKKGVSETLDGVKKLITGSWTGIKEWWNTNVAPKFTLEYWKGVFSNIGEGLKEAVSNAIGTAKQMFTDFMSGLSFSGIGEKLSGAVSNAVSGIGEFVGNISLSIPKFANGGFIEDGLFTMNHGEIAGRFNNGQSVVANNEQIIAGISEGVYKAVAAAMGSKSEGNQSINVYLDGKQIYASVKKTESERGKQLFGNQLGYGF